jgi:hypothetical protein
MKLSNIYRKTMPIIRTGILAVGIGLFGYGCGSGKKIKKRANLPTINLRSCIKKEQKARTIKPRQKVIIAKAPKIYKSALKAGDKRGNSNGKLDWVTEVRSALAEYSKSHGKSDLRKFFDYIWQKNPDLFKTSNGAKFATRLLLKTYPYNWNKKQIDIFISNKMIDDLIGVMPKILMGIRQRKPKEVLRKIRQVTKSITDNRFDYNWAVRSEIVKNRILDRADGRPLAVIVYPNPRSDYNGFFKGDGPLFGQLIKEGYRVMYYEATTDRQFYSALKQATGHQKARVILIGGHGSKKTLDLGGGKYWRGEIYHLDVSDKQEMLREKIGDTLEDSGAVILNSCSTGEGRETGRNLANIMREIFPQASRIWSADKILYGYPNIRFGYDHRIVDMISSYTYDPYFGNLACPSYKWSKDKKYISVYIKNLKLRLLKYGVSSEHAKYLWCMAVSGKKEKGDKVVKELVNLWNAKREIARIATSILMEIARGKGKKLSQLIAKNEYLPQIFAAWEKGTLPEKEAWQAIVNISYGEVRRFLRNSIRKGDPIKDRSVLKTAIKMGYGVNKDFLSALLITSLAYKGKNSPNSCNLLFSSVEALAYSFLVEQSQQAEFRKALGKIVLNKSEDKRLRRAAARILGDVGDKASKKILKKILGIGIFNFRDNDEKLCQIALESLKKIRKSK